MKMNYTFMIKKLAFTLILTAFTITLCNDSAKNLASLEINLNILSKLLPEKTIDLKQMEEDINTLFNSILSKENPDELKNENLSEILSKILQEIKNYKKNQGDKDYDPLIKQYLNKIDIVYKAYPEHEFITNETSTQAAQLIMNLLLTNLQSATPNTINEEQAKDFIRYLEICKKQKADCIKYENHLSIKAQTTANKVQKIKEPSTTEDIENLIEILNNDIPILTATFELNLIPNELDNLKPHLINLFKKSISTIALQAENLLFRQLAEDNDNILIIRKTISLIEQLQNVMKKLESFLEEIPIKTNQQLEKALKDLRGYTKNYEQKQEEGEKEKQQEEEQQQKIEKIESTINKIAKLIEKIEENPTLATETFPLLLENFEKLLEDNGNFRQLIVETKKLFEPESSEFKNLQKSLNKLLIEVKKLLEEIVSFLQAPDPNVKLRIISTIDAQVTSLEAKLAEQKNSPLFTYDDKNFNAFDIFQMQEYKDQEISQLSEEKLKQAQDKLKKQYRPLLLKFHPDRSRSYEENRKTFFEDKGIDISEIANEKLFDLIQTAHNLLENILASEKKATEKEEIQQKIKELNQLRLDLLQPEGPREKWLEQLKDFLNNKIPIIKDKLYPV